MQVRIYAETKRKELATVKLKKIMTKHSISNHTFIEIRYLSYSLVSTSRDCLGDTYIRGYLRVFPEDPRAVSHLIYLHSLNNEYKEVLKLAKGYRKKWEDDISILNSQAKAYAKLEKKAKAMALLQYIATMSKDKTVIAKALYDQAMLRDPDTEFDSIVQTLEQSHQHDPNEEADEYLAALYVDSQMFDKADHWVTEVSKRIDIGQNPCCLEIKAKIQVHRKNYDEAIATYVMLASIDEENGAHYNAMIEEIANKQQAPPDSAPNP